MEDEFILFPLKCHRFLASRCRGWRCLSRCTVCMWECVCVWGYERETHWGRGVGKGECVSKDGASGALLRIEIWSRSTKPLRHSPYLGGWYQDLGDSEHSVWIIPPTPPTVWTIWPSVNFKHKGSVAAHQPDLPSLHPHRLGVTKWSAQIVYQVAYMYKDCHQWLLLCSCWGIKDD